MIASGFMAHPKANPVRGTPPTAPCSITQETPESGLVSARARGTAAEIPNPRFTVHPFPNSRAARLAIKVSSEYSRGSTSLGFSIFSPDNAGS